MLSDCYSDLVPETGERLCCYDDVENAAPRLPLATASFDEAADRLVVGAAAGGGGCPIAASGRSPSGDGDAGAPQGRTRSRRTGTRAGHECAAPAWARAG